MPQGPAPTREVGPAGSPPDAPRAGAHAGESGRGSRTHTRARAVAARQQRHALGSRQQGFARARAIRELDGGREQPPACGAAHAWGLVDVPWRVVLRIGRFPGKIAALSAG